jgi:hypothetical protein
MELKRPVVGLNHLLPRPISNRHAARKGICESVSAKLPYAKSLETLSSLAIRRIASPSSFAVEHSRILSQSLTFFG